MKKRAQRVAATKFISKVEKERLDHERGLKRQTKEAVLRAEEAEQKFHAAASDLTAVQEHLSEITEENNRMGMKVEDYHAQSRSNVKRRQVLEMEIERHVSNGELAEEALDLLRNEKEELLNALEQGSNEREKLTREQKNLQMSLDDRFKEIEALNRYMETSEEEIQLLEVDLKTALSEKKQMRQEKATSEKLLRAAEEELCSTMALEDAKRDTLHRTLAAKLEVYRVNKRYDVQLIKTLQERMTSLKSRNTALEALSRVKEL